MTVLFPFVINAGLNFALGLLIAYFLGPAEFGRYAIGAAIGAGAMLFSGNNPIRMLAGVAIIANVVFFVYSYLVVRDLGESSYFNLASFLAAALIGVCLGVMAGAFVVASAAAVIGQVTIARAVSELADRVVPIQRDVEQIRRAYNDQETGQRAFILTGNPASLELYDFGKVVADELLARLRKELGDDRQGTEILDRVAAAATVVPQTEATTTSSAWSSSGSWSSSPPSILATLTVTRPAEIAFLAAEPP